MIYSVLNMAANNAERFVALDFVKHFLEEHPKEAKSIVSKVVLAAQARHAARKAREMVQRKNERFGLLLYA